jgi:hypothetical protein
MFGSRILLLFLWATLLHPSVEADPSKFVSRSDVEGLAKKMAFRLREFACDQLLIGRLDEECGRPGLYQLLQSLGVKSEQDTFPQEYLVQQILPGLQAILDPVKR